ncbi:MAG: hypothetical protein H6599_10585 [Flavobacteriales bacterium]|nr:hypothetical protein [Flavobacteriales bacterium]
MKEKDQLFGGVVFLNRLWEEFPFILHFYFLWHRSLCFFEPDLIFKHSGNTWGYWELPHCIFDGFSWMMPMIPKPLLKFGVQILCGVILIFSGTTIKLVDYDWINYALTILWVIGIMNSIKYVG